MLYMHIILGCFIYYWLASSYTYRSICLFHSRGLLGAWLQNQSKKHSELCLAQILGIMITQGKRKGRCVQPLSNLGILFFKGKLKKDPWMRVILRWAMVGQSSVIANLLLLFVALEPFGSLPPTEESTLLANCWMLWGKLNLL